MRITKEKACILINVAVAADRNVTQKVMENKWIKEFMYRDTTNVEHEIYGYTGYNRSHRNITEGSRKNLESILGKHSAESLQQTAILGTSHITWKVLQYEVWSLNGGDQRWFKRSTTDKRPVASDNINNNNNDNNIIIYLYQQTWCTKFYNKFISSLYMFRAPCAHRQEGKIVLYSLWYHHTYRWPSSARDGHL